LSQAVLLDTFPRERHAFAMAMWGMGVMIGPIAGPALGAWLTESYNWHWVFYINLPFGLLALFGILAFVPETRRERRRFDLFGFAFLSLAIGALQLMLDRGTAHDWFSSTEILVEAGLAVLCLYLFIVHMFTARQPFIEPALFKDPNFAAGLVLIFVVGIILLATLALLPPFLQNLMGYPVITTGLVLAPRGIGTMVAMMLVGRLSGRIDMRLMILAGLGLTALSLGEMARFTLDVGVWTLVSTGVTQGLGLGFIFVPLSTTTFATLAPQHRTEGTAMFSLMRNLGSSIGVSAMVTLLGQQAQRTHAALVESLTPFSPMLQAPWLPPAWSPQTAAGLAALNGEVTRQAAAVAYLGDFEIMMWVTLLAVPLLLLLGGPRRRPAAA